MKVFYHSGDLDGKCAGAVVKHKFPEAGLIGVDYDEGFPWHDVDSKTFMVDYSLSPADMKKLDSLTELYWIDHHLSTLRRVEEAVYPKIIKGLRNAELAACELSWKYLFPLEPVPFAVNLLSLYDIWDHENFMVLPFQYGARLLDLDPNNQSEWKKLFKLKRSDSMVDEIMEKGRIVLFYLKAQNSMICRKMAFEVTFHDLSCLAINHAFSNSKVFDSVETGEYDMFIIFRFTGKSWVISLYSKKVDCSLIAISHYGGGHAGAAGFVCDELPFKLPKS